MAPLDPEPAAADLMNRSNLTRSQFLMWLGQEIDPEVPLYNMIQTFRIAGRLDASAFDQAWQSLVRRSDALRTRVESRDEAPWRTVLDAMTVPVEVIDLTDAPDPEDAARRWVEDRKARPLKMGERLWDTALLLLADDLSVWYLCQHHLITDGQSFALVYRHVAEGYALALEGRLDEAPPLPAYEAYVSHERQARSSPAAAKATEYWQGKLAPPREPTPFYGRSVSGRTPRTDRLVLAVSAQQSNRLRDIARQTEFRSFSDELARHAIWAALMLTTVHRITGQTRLRVGTPWLGRQTAAFRETIGLFIEIGCLDAQVERDDTFPTLVRRVQGELMQGLLHAQPGVSSPELNRSYDVLVNNVTSRFEPFAGLPVTTEWVHSGYGDRDHALRLQVVDFDATGAFRLYFDVNRDVFGEAERAWLLEQFQAVLDRFTQDPTRGLASFDLLDEARRRRLEEWNRTDADYPRDATVVDLFEAQARATPLAVAVQSRERTLTYTGLDVEANRIGHLLQQHGVGTGDTVALCLPRSCHAVSAIFGILKIGAAYVPIDPAYPAERQRLMIDDARPTVVLTAGNALGPEKAGITVVDLTTSSLDELPDLAPPAERRAEGLAYVIYTSGSTGRPKGTLLTHRGLVNYLWWAKREYQQGQALDFALYSSLSFDLTITSLFVPLISGGRVVVYQGSAHGEGLEILDVFAEDQVDVVKLTPAHLSLLREHGLSRRTRIRRLIVGGENLRTELAHAVSEAFSHEVAIFNEYGPTETVVGCMVHRYDPAADTGPSVPIGRPAANARIHVLDAYDQPTPPGVAGEMVVSGDGVALGYRNQPELTAQRFGDDPTRPGARWYRTGDLARWGADGRLEFLGRRDQQVKIRGARIELGEIETALVAHPDIESAVVAVVAVGDAAPDRVGHCRTCGLESSYPGADFDSSGECADCRAYARYREQVARYFRTPEDLHATLGEVRARAVDGPQDCIVLTSGGKDSTYMLYRLVRDYGMRPLVFTLDNGYLSDTALDNVRAACTDLGIELHVAQTPHMKAIFADSLRRHANVCDGCFKTVYTLSMSLARERGIGTIITGLSRGQLFETRLADTFAAREFDPATIDAWVIEARKAYHHIDDAVFQLLERDLFRNEAIFDEVRFVDFYRFVDVGLDEVYRYLSAETAWQRPPDTGRSTNCLINDVGIYVHKKTRGFHNYSLPYGWDVRLGHKRREAAMRELQDEIDLTSVRRILRDIDFGEPLEQAAAEKRLVAYYVARSDLGPSEVRAHLASRLPAYMVPSYLIPLRELPLTVNGKVNHQALPDPRQTRPVPATAFVAPGTATERRLAAIWSQVFKLPAIGVHDNFFEIGGDSITSIQVVAAARREGMALSAPDIFRHQTIAALAAGVDAKSAVEWDEAAPAAAFQPSDEVRERVAAMLADSGGWEAIESAYPLTPTQLGMLYHSRLSADPQTYFGQGTCTFGGQVDAAAFEQAWRAVCRRHPATRVRFVWSGLDEPLQLVQREAAFPWTEHDWRGRTVEEVRSGLAQLRHRQRAAGFDLGGPYLMSFTLVRTDESAHFVWNSHHALLDGWSAHLLFDEVLNEYEALVGGAPSTPRRARAFSDHVGWLAGQDGAGARSWWQAYLAGVEEATPLPLPSPPRDGRGGHGTAVRTLDAATSARVQVFAREHRLTLSSLASAAWALLLSHYSESSDVVFGSTVSGREEGVAGVEGMVGMLIATLPIRVRLDPDRPVLEWLQTVQEDGLDARRHGHLGLAEIQQLTHVPVTQPLFESIVVGENYPAATAAATSRLRPSPLEIGAPSNYPLALLFYPREQLTLEAVYDRSRLSPDAIARLLGHLEHALSSIADAADRRLRDVQVVTEGERAVLRSWEVGPRAAAPVRLLHEQIAAHATTMADAPAVVGADGELTYRELEQRANQLAHGLRALGVERGHAVGVMAGGSAGLVAGVLAVLKTGAAYVPLEPAMPAERLARVVAETSMRALVLDGDFAAPLVPLPPALDVRSFAYADHPSEPPEGGPSAEDLAYVIYTSGSTGVPKGVMVTHRNLAHSTAARFAFYGEPVGSFLLLSSLAFDSSMVGLFWTLASGGLLVIPPPERRLDVGYLGLEIERHAVTHLLALPSLYGLLLDESAGGRLRSLRTVMVAGEACPAALIASHRSRCAGATLYNEYGPTEGTVWSHAFRVGPGFDGESVPIGAPIPNSTCRVLDHFGHPTAIGVPGELVIGGPGVAAGYLGRPELTEAAFVSLPPAVGSGPRERYYRTGDRVRWREDGQLDFLGRRDRQVKLRGYRIELDEVERALLDQPGVRAAAVIVTDGASSDASRRRLVAFYCADDDLGEGPLRAAVAARLPSFMLPSEFVRLAGMPMTPTGKVDRPALASLAATGAAPATAPPREPADEVERMLRDAWVRILGLPDVSVDQNFFELGGNSLDAMRLFAQIERSTGCNLRLSTLLDAPTIARLADEIRRAAAPAGLGPGPDEAGRLPSPLVTIRSGDSRPALFCVHGAGGNVLEFRALAERLSAEQPVYGLEAHGIDGVTPLSASIDEMAGLYHDAIRAARPHGPYVIGGYSGGGVVALEIARRLTEAGARVIQVVLLDTYHPSAEARRLVLADHVSGLATQGVAYLPRRVRARALRQWASLRDSTRLRYYSRRGGVLPHDLREAHLTRRFAAIVRGHTPRPYDGPVTLFRAAEVDRIFAHVGPRLGWDLTLLPRLEVVTIPGDHHSLFRPPTIRVLASRLEDLLLRSAQADTAGDGVRVPERAASPEQAL